MVSHLVLSKENYEPYAMFADSLLKRHMREPVHVIDRNGVGITHMSRVGFELDVDILSSLVSGNVATANALAALIGEAGFDSQIHQGENGAFFVSQSERDCYLLCGLIMPRHLVWSSLRLIRRQKGW